MSDSKADAEELLVAVDFSPCSLRGLDAALKWRTQNAEITVLHVVDAALIEHIDAVGLGHRDELLARLRTRAEDEMARLMTERAGERAESMIVVGEPFVEIIKIANDLECDLIVIGTRGDRAQLKDLLFGGTAEKVVRGASRPVLCVP